MRFRVHTQQLNVHRYVNRYVGIISVDHTEKRKVYQRGLEEDSVITSSISGRLQKTDLHTVFIINV